LAKVTDFSASLTKISRNIPQNSSDRHHPTGKIQKSRSKNGTETFAKIGSVIGTALKQGESLIKIIANLFHSLPRKKRSRGDSRSIKEFCHDTSHCKKKEA
jgi:hypothetical protein